MAKNTYVLFRYNGKLIDKITLIRITVDKNSVNEILLAKLENNFGDVVYYYIDFKKLPCDYACGWLFHE